MKTSAFTLALIAGAALAGAAFAQPSGGPDAKGNAPLKAPHTVNDGMAKHGANSFTEGQAREHIEKSGFTGVTGLAKGQDGVWRGQAMRDGRTMDVAMDFKGNVSTPAGAPAMSSSRMSTTRAATMPTREADPAMAAGPPMAAAMPQGEHAMHRRHMRRRHHRHHSRRCAEALRAGAACSGVDRNDNGVSDREDRMHGRTPN